MMEEKRDIYVNDSEAELKNQYNEMMNETEVPMELAEKLLNAEAMRDNNKVVSFGAHSALRRIGIVAAAFVGVILLSNVVTYAATGEAWLQLLWGKHYEHEINTLTHDGAYTGTVFKVIPVKNKSGKIEYHQISYGVDGEGRKTTFVGSTWVDENSDAKIDKELIATEVEASAVGEVTAEQVIQKIDVSDSVAEKEWAKDPMISEDGILTLEQANVFVNGEKAEVIHITNTMDGLFVHIAEYEKDSVVYLIVVSFRDGKPDVHVFLGEPIKVE